MGIASGIEMCPGTGNGISFELTGSYRRCRIRDIIGARLESGGQGRQGRLQPQPAEGRAAMSSYVGQHGPPHLAAADGVDDDRVPLLEHVARSIRQRSIDLLGDALAERVVPEPLVERDTEQAFSFDVATKHDGTGPWAECRRQPPSQCRLARARPAANGHELSGGRFEEGRGQGQMLLSRSTTPVSIQVVVATRRRLGL